MLSTENPLKIQRFRQAESKEMEKKLYYHNINQKKDGVAVSISDKTKFKTRKIIGIKRELK